MESPVYVNQRIHTLLIQRRTSALMGVSDEDKRKYYPIWKLLIDFLMTIKKKGLGQLEDDNY